MSDAGILITVICALLFGVPLLLLLFWWQRNVINNAKHRGEIKRSYAFDESIKKLNSCIKDVGNLKHELASRADNYIVSRITDITSCLSTAIIAFTNEYGSSVSLELLQKKATILTSKITKDWQSQNDYRGADLYLSSSGYKKLVELNNELNAFVTEAIRVLTESKCNKNHTGFAINSSNRRIFIVHGHNTVIRNELYDFLQDNEFEPIILENEDNKGQFILEKFLATAASVSYAIVLMTADDCALGKDEKINLRARQNVILELGFFIAHLGRERIIILRDNGVENPSDIAGITYESIGQGDEWKKRVLRELYAIGYEHKVVEK